MSRKRRFSVGARSGGGAAIDPRFIEGPDQQHVALIPECLDDFLAVDNPLRIIDAFFDELNLASLEVAFIF